jgi:hypothetical protein
MIIGAAVGYTETSQGSSSNTQSYNPQDCIWRECAIIFTQEPEVSLAPQKILRINYLH